MFGFGSIGELLIFEPDSNILVHTYFTLSSHLVHTYFTLNSHLLHTGPPPAGVTLQHLHTLQTRKFFESKQTTETGESLVSVTHVNLCLSGRVLVIAYASSQILVLNWNNTEVREMFAYHIVYIMACSDDGKVKALSKL